MKKQKTKVEGPDVLDLFGASSEEKLSKAWDLARAAGRRCVRLREQLNETRSKGDDGSTHIAELLQDAEKEVRELETKLREKNTQLDDLGELADALRRAGYPLSTLGRVLWRAGLLNACTEASPEEIARSLIELLESLPQRRGC